MKRFLSVFIVILLAAWSGVALAQSTPTPASRASLETQNNTFIYTNGQGAITAATLNPLLGNYAASMATLLDPNVFLYTQTYLTAPIFAAQTGYCYANGNSPITCSTSINGASISGTNVLALSLLQQIPAQTVIGNRFNATGNISTAWTVPNSTDTIIPLVHGAVAAGDYACFADSLGTLDECGSPGANFAATFPLSVSFSAGVTTYALNYNSTLALDGSNNLGINLANANTWTAAQTFPNSSITNAELANPSTTVNGIPCTLGSTCTITSGSGTVNSGSSGQVGYYASTGTAISGESLSALLDASLGSTQGSVLYRGASTWTVLTPGASGFFLETQGTSANPTWAPASGGSGCSTGGSAGNLLTSNGSGGCTTDTNSSLTNGALSLGSSGTAGSVAMGNATSGTVTIQPTTGALGSSVLSAPAHTGTLADSTDNLGFFASTTSAQLAGIISDGTGSGSLVFATSPTLITPALGTPSAVVLTHGTGLPISSGVSGLGTGIAAALAVNVGIAGSPVINGGALGTPSSGTATNLTGLPISGLTGLGTGVATGLATAVNTASGFATYVLATNSAFGLMEGDGSTITCTAGVCSASAVSGACIQDFVASTDYTPGTTTSLVTTCPVSTVNGLSIYFDGVRQSQDTWSLSSSTVTFDAAIPSNTQVVEFQSGGLGTNGTVTGPGSSTVNDVAAFGGTSGQSIIDTHIPYSTVASLTASDQTLSGGANITVSALTTGSVTLDCGKNPGQYISNTGAFTITAPSSDGLCDVQIENGTGAGAVTFSGFSEGSNTGDTLDTTSGHKFLVGITRIHGTSHYLISALQ